MSEAKGRTFFLPILLMLVALTAGQSAFGQNNKPSDETVQELLTEVRMLRQALQMVHRMSLDTYRSQLLVDRIRVAREDIRRLTGSLNESQDLLVKTQATIPQFIERQKMMEARARVEVDQIKKEDMELEARQTKEAVERYKSQLEPLKERQQQLTVELNAAKAKAEELESRLDALERAIENDRQKLDVEKPVQKVP